MNARQCPFCGKLVANHLASCPYCREAIPDVRGGNAALASGDTGGGRGKIRAGLLCMLFGGVVNYFAGGYSAMNLPFPIEPVVNTYLAPLLFLSGLGLLIHGFLLGRKA